jgi:drug/metabolite transporter (DMT)-like permease
METWMVFAIASIFTIWFYNFTLKIAAEKNYNVSIINIYSYLIWILFLWTYLLFEPGSIDYSVIYTMSIFAFLNWLLFILWVFSRIESMKNIDTVIFFPLYKTVWPILVTGVSLFFFKETLQLKEIIGIIIWISVPLLLITSSENKKQKNLCLWIILVLITAILSTIGSWISKEVMLREYNIVFYVFMISIFWLLSSIFSYYYLNQKNKKYNHKWIWKFSLISWILHTASFFTFMLALKWNLAIVFTISSFSIIIPIILSIIFYNDHFNMKKWFVIALSIISILFFI